MTEKKKLSLRSLRYCVGARLKFWRRSRVPKRGSRDEAVELFLAASPSNLTRLYYNGSAAKCHSTTTQYRQLRRLEKARVETRKKKKRTLRPLQHRVRRSAQPGWCD